MAVLARRASDVRITEVDLSSTLTNSSSASSALVMVSAQGPIGPKFYSNSDEFLFDYGNPNAAVSFDHYAALDYFKEGNSLWATRALGTTFAHAAAVLKLDATLSTVISGVVAGIPNNRNTPWSSLVIAGETAIYAITSARGPGSYGNTISVTIDSDNLNAPSGGTGTSSTTGGTLIAGTYEYVVSALGPSGETLASPVITIVIGGVSTTNSVTLNWVAQTGAIGYKIYGRASPAATMGLITTIGSGAATYLDAGILPPSATLFPITTAAGLPTASTIFRLKVYDTAVSTSNPVETFVCSTTEQVDEAGAQMETTQRINPFSRYIRVESNISNLAGVPTLRSAGPTLLLGGASGTAPTSANINTSWNIFLNKEAYQIDILMNSGKYAVSVQQNMDLVATTRNDCVAYLDMPSTSQTAQAAVDYRNLTLNLNSSYSALISSDLLESDPITGKFLYVPPSGAIASLQARTTRIGQPWFSTAGLNRGILRVLDLRNAYSDGDATILYKANISYLRKIAGMGIAFWEQNTLLNKNSAFQFLNIRVLSNIIKRATYQYLIYGLQEPNDDILRKQLAFGLEDYLRSVKAGRGISSYRIVIDESINTPALTNTGILAIAVIIVPIIAVREIQLSLVVSKQGLEITERELAAL